MKRLTFLCVGLSVFTLGAVLLPPSRAAEVTKISSLPEAGLVIDQPGHYLVTADLTYTGPGHAIEITASDVHLNLGGHTLTGTANALHGIFVNQATNVRIKNGTVTGFTRSDVSGVASVQASANGVNNLTITGNFHGLVLNASSDNEIWECDVSGNDHIGVALISSSNGNSISFCDASRNGDHGVIVYQSNGNTLESNTANENRFKGFDVSEANENSLNANTANGNGETGFGLFRSTANVLSSSNASGNVAHGIVLDLGSNDNSVRGNTATDNGSLGFAIVNQSNNNTFDSNIANDNGNSGYVLSASSGNVITSSDASGNVFSGIVLDGNANTDNIIRGNMATDNGTFGIAIATGSVGNTIEGNLALDNATIDLGGQDLHDNNPMLAGSCPNTWRDNTFETKGGLGAECIH